MLKESCCCSTTQSAAEMVADVPIGAFPKAADVDSSAIAA